MSGTHRAADGEEGGEALAWDMVGCSLGDAGIGSHSGFHKGVTKTSAWSSEPGCSEDNAVETQVGPEAEASVRKAWWNQQDSINRPPSSGP